VEAKAKEPVVLKFKKIYGKKIEKEANKFGNAPGHLKVLPHMEWYLHSRP